MTIWGFLSVVVICFAAAWVYIRKRVAADVSSEQRAATERAKSDAAKASAQRNKTAGQIVALGTAKGQAERVASSSGAAEESIRLANDLREQADAVAGLLGSPSPVGRSTPVSSPERGK